MKKNKKNKKKVSCPEKGKEVNYFYLLEICNNVEERKRKKVKANVKKKQDGGLWGKEGGCWQVREEIEKKRRKNCLVIQTHLLIF